ncbi:MAG: hypothetical protein ACRDND_33590 [Streptosporangiaceae bacterium]
MSCAQYRSTAAATRGPGPPSHPAPVAVHHRDFRRDAVVAAGVVFCGGLPRRAEVVGRRADVRRWVAVVAVVAVAGRGDLRR